MRKMTEEFLLNAFAGESMAHMKYLVFAEIAEKEGFPNIARLFRAIAYAEFVHAKNHLNALGKVSGTAQNLDVAYQGESFEIDEMYPAYKAVAELQEEKQALRSINYALEAEKIHKAMYSEAKESVEKRKEDIKIGDIYICPVCGYTVEGEAPERCPVCNVPKEKFVKF
ncbi:MAG: rubrerythrin family protein [candidate division WOR-3 bacterium]